MYIIYDVYIHMWLGEAISRLHHVTTIIRFLPDASQLSSMLRKRIDGKWIETALWT